MIEPRSEIVLPAKPMVETLAYFREQLGFRLESIVPADDPRQAVLVASGQRILLDADHCGDPGLLQIQQPSGEPPRATCQAPNGTRIRFVRPAAQLTVPQPDDTPIITTRADDDRWINGRAGMLYRDLIPGRLNGYLIASHIRIPEGGPVPDDVHFHDVHLQLIYCYRGWVRLVYEDQGEPFVMRAGDCVLQPPKIRHRVLEASDGLEVIELACPSVHLTTLDHEMDLPNDQRNPTRSFGGQRFHWHQHASANWHREASSDWQSVDLGIAAASDGIADATVLRSGEAMECVEAGLTFVFVLTGACEISIAETPLCILGSGDCVAIPAGQTFAIKNANAHCQLLRLCTVPGSNHRPACG